MSQPPDQNRLEQLLTNMESHADFTPDVMVALGKPVPEDVFEHVRGKRFAFSSPALSANTATTVIAAGVPAMERLLPED